MGSFVIPIAAFALRRFVNRYYVQISCKFFLTGESKPRNLLLPYGGIEDGIRKRLDCLKYLMVTQGLLPDPRISGWVLQQAESPNSAQ